MSYRTYNTRNSNAGRYNSGQFVSGGEMGQQGAYSPAPLPPLPPLPPASPAAPAGGAPGYTGTPRPTYTPTQLRVADLKANDVDMRQDEGDDRAPAARPAWMKSKLDGVKKISKKERRRRQNNNLRRLITPKNALMVLNEMIPGENVASNIKVEHATAYNNKNNNFCADLALDGVVYKGFGENKLMARNAAAEQAIRDLIIKKMNTAFSDDVSTTDEGSDPLPMLQIASFALHKLFAEWEYDGHKVPVRRLTSQQSAEPAAAAPPAPPKPPRAVPVNAAQLHPCMLLTYMRPAACYRPASAALPPPPPPPPPPAALNPQPSYTMAVEVDGNTWTGTASNKKEARRMAAKACCEALFGVQFEPVPSSNVPQPPQ